MERMNEKDIRQAAGGAAEENIPAGWTQTESFNPKASICSKYVSNAPWNYQNGRWCCGNCVNFTEVRSIGDKHGGKGYCTKGM